MDGIHCTKTHPFKGERQCLYCVSELQMFGSKRQECKGLSTSCVIRDTRDLIAQRLRIQQSKFFGLNRCQHSKYRLSFDPDARVSLVIQRALQATVVKIDTHNLILLALAWTTTAHHIRTR